MTRQPTAFISYSSKDAAFAERLAVDLRSHGVGIWLDKWEMRVGESLIARIEEGIAARDFLLVLLSPRSVDSPWVQKELRTALMRELASRRVVVLPAVIEECVVPEFLREKLYADFRQSYDEGLVSLVRSMTSLLIEASAFDPADALRGEWGIVRRLHAAPVGSKILALTEDPILRLWRVPEGTLERAFFARRSVVDAVIAPKGDVVVAALNHDLEGGKLLVFDAATGREIASHFVGDFKSRPSLSALAAGRDGVLAGFEDGALLRVPYGEGEEELLASAPFAVIRLAVAEEAGTIAVAGHDTGVCLGSPKDGFGGVEICPGSRVYDLALAPDGRTLACATAAEDGIVVVDTRTRQQQVRTQTDQTSAVAFSPDGKLLAAGDWDGGVYLYESPAWESVAAVRAHSRMVGAVTFCDGGKYLATGGGREDPSLKIWDIHQQRLVCTIKGTHWDRGV